MLLRYFVPTYFSKHSSIGISPTNNYFDIEISSEGRLFYILKTHWYSLYNEAENNSCQQNSERNNRNILFSKLYIPQLCNILKLLSLLAKLYLYWQVEVRLNISIPERKQKFFRKIFFWKRVNLEPKNV